MKKQNDSFQVQCYLWGALLLFFLLFHACVHPIVRSASSRQSPLFAVGKFQSLDMNLYWFGTQTRCVQAGHKGSSRYYDPAKPTMLYVHGWQIGATGKRMREDFWFRHAGGPKKDVTQAWRNKGWNLGMMYWNQLSDESDVQHAEAKIWSIHGPKKMRWQSQDKRYHSGSSLKEPVGVQLAKTYMRQMKHQKGRIRLVGHSLGSQAVLAMLQVLFRKVRAGTFPARLLPKRVALLDPFFSNGTKLWLNGKTPAEHSKPILHELLRRGILLEVYYTSGMVNHPLIGDPNRPLTKMAAVSVLKPHYFHGLDFPRKHIMARWYYFWSMSFPAPKVVGTGQKGLSAGSSDTALRWWMNSPFKTVQQKGSGTLTLRDDVMGLHRK